MAVTIITPPGTRFESLLVAGNFLERLQAVSDSTRRIIQQVSQDYQVRRLGYHGVVANDPAFQLQVDFSDDDGASFSEPMVNVVGNRIYQMRVRVTQHQVYPMVLGWGLLWTLPTGWEFTDAIPTTTYEDAVSNPLTVTRVMRSPANPQPAAFIVSVVEQFN